jgi:hypothetical protein
MTTSTSITRLVDIDQQVLRMDSPLSWTFTPEQQRDVREATTAYILAHKNEGGASVFAGICREWVDAHDCQQAAIRAERPAFTLKVIPKDCSEPAFVLCSRCQKQDEPHRMQLCPACCGQFCAECYGLHECKEFIHHPYGR